MKSAAHPLTRAVLEQIVRDEAQHGRLGFLYLEWVEERLDDAERQRLAEVALDTIRTLAPLWQRLRIGADDLRTEGGYLIADVRQMGWMVAAEYQQLAHRAIREEVVEPLAAFGIIVPAAEVDAMLHGARPDHGSGPA